MAGLLPLPKQQFFDTNGNPLVGGKVYTYSAGTTTLLASYTSASGGTVNPNPVILDARGEASIWLTNASYKIALTDYNDVLLYTVDNISIADPVAIAVSIATLTASDATINAAIANEATIRATADTALFAQISSVTDTGTVVTDALGVQLLDGQSTNSFTAASSGVYLFSCRIDLYATANTFARVAYYKNNVNVDYVMSTSGADGVTSAMDSYVSFWLNLVTNDTIKLTANTNTPGRFVNIRNFTVIKIR